VRRDTSPSSGVTTGKSASDALERRGHATLIVDAENDGGDRDALHASSKISSCAASMY
jgi:hypothetical protein